MIARATSHCVIFCLNSLSGFNWAADRGWPVKGQTDPFLANHAWMTLASTTWP